MVSIFSVLKELKSRDSSALHPQNMFCMSFTFAVLKLLKLSVVRELQ